MAGFAPMASDRKVVASSATAEHLTSAPYPCSAVYIQAETDNTGIIMVGGSNIAHAQTTRIGIVLNPSDIYPMRCRDLYDIWVRSSVNGDGVTYNVLTE